MVFVLDKHKKPLMPCSEKKARQLLERKHAVVHKIVPFCIRLKFRTLENSCVQPIIVKIDPGSKVTGIALLVEVNNSVFKTIKLIEVHHRIGISDRITKRRQLRRFRRYRKVRYREARFNNRKRCKGWLPPSLTARVNQTINVIKKLKSLCPIVKSSIEHVKFDTQLLENPNIDGTQYQQGTLFGYDIREYLLEKWKHRCAYCGVSDVPLEIEHIIPISRSGSSRLSNLCISCKSCNQRKGKRTAEEFGFPGIQEQAKKTIPLCDAAFMNLTRYSIRDSLKVLIPEVELGSGSLTKMNRMRMGLPKEHYYDAVCVGNIINSTIDLNIKKYEIWKSCGRGNRQMCRTDKFGFPKSHRQLKKKYFGFKTGDLVKAEVTKGKKIGSYRGRVAIRKTGYFRILGSKGELLIDGVSWKTLKLLQLDRGWNYSIQSIN